MDCNSTKLGNVKFLGYIGEGSYGEVWKVKWKGKLAAGKQLKGFLFNCNEYALQHFLAEYEFLRGLSHPNIVQLFALDVFDEYPDPVPPMIITELMHQDLYTYIENSTTEPKVQFMDTISIMLDVAEGLEYLHNLPRPIIHRDLSAKNILLDKNIRAKISDLGQAKMCPNPCLISATPTPGCIPYVAPETFPLDNPSHSYNPDYGTEVDTFSFGVVLLEVVIGKHPRPEDRIHPRDKSIVSERIRRRRDIDEMNLLCPVRELVLQCLEDKPSKRPRASRIVTYLQKWKDGKQRLTLKVILVGNSDTGKTTLLRRYVNPEYPFDMNKATIGFGTHFVPVRYRDGLVTLQLLDTAGQEKFNSIPPIVLRGAHGAFVVYDVTDPQSFMEVDAWIQRVRDECDENVRVILIGNKVDQERRVARERVEDYAERNNVEYIETSAKTLENVEMMFEHMKEKLLEELRESDLATVSLVVSFSEQRPPQSKCCD